MKKKLATVIMLFFVLATVYAQNDETFQKYLSTLQPILSKNTEVLNSSDVELLKKTMNLPSNTFGESNQRLCSKMINDAKTKKREYDEYLEKSKNMANTLDKLDEETGLRVVTEQERDSLHVENTKLQAVIAELNKHISSYKKQANKLQAMNKKLQSENLATKDLLQASSDMVSQLVVLMPKRSLDAKMRDSLPQTLQDSLADAQCRVAMLLKSNYMITLESMRGDKQFMDTAVIYFETNKQHLAAITNYVDAGHELVYRLRNSGVDCAVGYAADIENEMNSFLLFIENANSENANLSSFIDDNIAWLVPVIILLIAGIILVIRKTSSKKEKEV